MIDEFTEDKESAATILSQLDIVLKNDEDWQRIRTRDISRFDMPVFLKALRLKLNRMGLNPFEVTQKAEQPSFIEDDLREILHKRRVMRERKAPVRSPVPVDAETWKRYHDLEGIYWKKRRESEVLPDYRTIKGNSVLRTKAYQQQYHAKYKRNIRGKRSKL